jgi:hypothetical protein
MPARFQVFRSAHVEPSEFCPERIDSTTVDQNAI